ncbi:MAG: T9SS type A sorting domain-containing protein [Phaeodactylibacter sp.]|nr:T9SS type A sorting domain-containing protein [Phaeodactylibacter sp.]
MKNLYALFSILFLAAWGLHAQPTCEDPEVVLEDDAENYASGDVSMQSPNWTVWPGGSATGAIVTDEESNGGTNSFKIDGSTGTTDALLLLGDQTSGHYILQWDMLVDSARQGYFNLQHEMPTASSGAWAFEAYFTEGGVGRLELYDGSDDVAFSYPENDWFTVRLLLDLDNDEARLLVGEVTVDAWQFSTGSTSLLQMNSINFWPADESYLFYVDNILLSEIPAPEEGQYCYTAVELTEPGFYEVPELTCYGAGYDLGGGAVGFAGYWFAYTPSQNGVLSIASCGGGVDTRGWIFSGECHDLRTVGINDDRCEIVTGGSDWASYREAYATAGTTYYIMWDDTWESDAFAFELGFTPTEEPAEGKFCQSAQVIGPGDYTILEITGEAAVAGPFINNTVSSTTAYTQSEWYAFTPDIDGYMGIFSCELAASDTYFFVYTGDCSSFETLELVALNDNGCADEEGNVMQMASLDSIAVTAGTTYYIEWIDRRIEQADPPQDELFGWTLTFDPILDVTEAELDAGVQVFPNPAGEQLNIRFEFDETVDVLNIELLDVLGQSLRRLRLNSAMAGAEQMSLHGLPAGMYLLRLSADGAMVTKPVVVR